MGDSSGLGWVPTHKYVSVCVIHVVGGVVRVVHEGGGMGCVVHIVGCELGVEIQRSGSTDTRTKILTCFDTSSHAVHDKGGMAHAAGDGGGCKGDCQVGSGSEPKI